MVAAPTRTAHGSVKGKTHQSSQKKKENAMQCTDVRRRGYVTIFKGESGIYVSNV
jgi:hypothetical protein